MLTLILSICLIFSLFVNILLFFACKTIYKEFIIDEKIIKASKEVLKDNNTSKFDKMSIKSKRHFSESKDN